MSSDSDLPKSAAEAVIAKFGGITHLARALDYPVTTVQGWKDRQKIPQDHWLKIIEAGSSVDIHLQLSDFLRRESEAAA